MVRIWLIGSLLALGVAGCGGGGDSEDGPTDGVRIVAADDGTVEVIVDGRTLFALAAETRADIADALSGFAGDDLEGAGSAFETHVFLSHRGRRKNEKQRKQ